MTSDQVYVIGNAANCLVKIGHSAELDRRLMALQAQSPVKLTLLGVFAGGRDVEQTLHSALKLFRKHGEWFELLSPEWETDPCLRISYELKKMPIWIPESDHDDEVWRF